MYEKNRLLLALVAIVALSVFSCGGNSGNKANENSQQEVSVNVVSTEFDIPGLNAQYEKKQRDLNSDDFDFLLNQYEILVAKTGKMSPQEYQAYVSGMSSDETMAIMVIGTYLENAEKDGKLSEKQQNRYASLSEQLTWNK